MDGSPAVTVSPAFQIDRHAAVAVNAVVAVVDLINLPFDFCFLSVIILLPVLPVVIVGIRIDPQPPQQPTDAEFFMMPVDESISL